MAEELKYTEVYRTNNPFHLSFVKSLLDANNIKYIVEGEECSKVRPWLVAARVKVDSTRFNDAMELLSEFRKSAGESPLK